MNEGAAQAQASDWRDSVKTIIETAKKLDALHSQMPYSEYKKMARSVYGMDDSAASKVCKIGKHPILSNPANEDKLPPHWGLLYEMTHIPNDVLQAKLDADGLRRTSKFELWGLRDKPVGTGHNSRGPRQREVQIPEGQTVTGITRHGLEMERTQELTAEQAAKAIGVGVQTYRMVRNSLMLADRDDLNVSDRITVDEVLIQYDRTRNVRRYYARLKPIVDRVWGVTKGGVYTTERSEKRAATFIDAIGIIRSMCDRAIIIEQPQLSHEEIENCVDELMEARKSLYKLLDNLRRATDE